jgi:hypothetical protein
MTDKQLKQLIKEEVKLVLEDRRAEIDAIVKLDHALASAKQVTLRNQVLKELFYSKIIALQTEIDDYLFKVNNTQPTQLGALQNDSPTARVQSYKWK